MKKTLFLAALCAVSFSLFTACDKPSRDFDDERYSEGGQDDDESEGEGGGTPSNPNGNQNTQQNYPDCFVYYYPGSQFIYKRTVGSDLKQKVVWTVTDYNAQTKTATIQTQYPDEDPGEIQIRNNNGMIEFTKYGEFKPVVSSTGDVNYLFNYKPSIPSGIYGSLSDKVSVSSVSIPGGTSVGMSVGASYQPYTGFHDSYTWDWDISETWCTECGFLRESSYWCNGKEYPISSSRSSMELIAYDIPLPDGTHKGYIPSGCETYDVTDTYCTYTHFTASTQRYDNMFFYWNDKKNKNVMRYTMNILWYEDGWKYAQMIAKSEYHTEFGGWFTGKESWGTAIGGPKNGVMFDCRGSYGTPIKSNYYLNEGTYIYFVLVENMVQVATPTNDTEFVAIQITYDDWASPYSIRIRLNEDGTADPWDTSAPRRAPGSLKVLKPDPSMITGPIHELK